MKKLLLLLFALLGTAGANAQVVTDYSTAGSPVTFATYVASAGTGAKYAFMMPSSSTLHQWCGFNSTVGRSATITKDFLFTLENSTTSGKYWLKRYSNGEYLAGNNSFSATTPIDLTLVNRTPGDLADEYNNSALHISFDNASGGHYNNGNGSYNFAGGTGGWSTYIAYGPYYVADVEYVDANNTPIQEGATYIVQAGTAIEAPSIVGYAVQGTSSVTVNADQTIKFTYNATATGTVKYQISDANGVVYTSEAIIATPGDVISALPSDYQRAYCSYTVTPTTVVANTENIVPVTVTYNMPFTASADYASAKWYVMSLRGYYLAYGESTPYTGTTTRNLKDEAQQWAFIGNPYAGINIINKAAGSGKYLSYDNAANNINPYMKDTEKAWVLDQNNSGFVFRMPEDNSIYMHLRTPNLSTCSVSEWGGVHNDAGSTLAVVEVPDVVVDVTYNFVVDGSVVNTATVQQAGSSAIAIPSDLIPSEYSTLCYDFPTTGTIGDTDCTITITATLKTGVITDLANLSNNKAYMLSTARGTLGTNGTQMVSTYDNSGYSASQFAIITYDEKYYLYSIADSKFVSPNQKPTLTDDISSLTALTFEAQATKHLFYMGMGSNGVNMGAGYFVVDSSTQKSGIVINGWTTRDPGNQYAIIAVADFDPKDAIDALDAYFHPANCYDRVEAEILPYLVADPTAANQEPATSIGKPFGISSEGASLFRQSYQTQWNNKQFSLEEYQEAKALLEENIIYPEDGKVYLVKNTSNNKYLHVAQHGEPGQVFADLTREEAADSASAHILVKYVNDKPYMISEGHEFIQVYGTSDKAWTNTAAAFDKYAHFVSVAPGVGAFSIAFGNGIGEWEYCLNPGFYAIIQGDEAYTVAGSTNGAASEYAHWTFEEIELEKGDINSDGNLDANDLKALVSIILGTNSKLNDAAGDVDNSGSVTLSDITALVNKIKSAQQ